MRRKPFIDWVGSERCYSTSSTIRHGGEQRLTENTVMQKAPSTRGNIPMNTILIGQKPMMAYATAIVMQINSGSKELSV